MKRLFIHKSILAGCPFYNLLWLEPQANLFLSTFNTIAAMTHIPNSLHLIINTFDKGLNFYLPIWTQKSPRIVPGLEAA